MPQKYNLQQKYNLVEIEWFDAQSGFGQAEFIDELIRDVDTISEEFNNNEGEI